MYNIIKQYKKLLFMEFHFPSWPETHRNIDFNKNDNEKQKILLNAMKNNPKMKNAISSKLSKEDILNKIHNKENKNNIIWTNNHTINEGLKIYTNKQETEVQNLHQIKLDLNKIGLPINVINSLVPYTHHGLRIDTRSQNVYIKNIPVVRYWKITPEYHSITGN